ncbi:hypothetical protein L228DRAFT_257970 [Xylona heveae TC161]|uniref:Zn(2)-C6 fungal-type domain-containing protein n=1 Tax=Xylona heveae (strain CBS 132557 / TC161) TaxID=1328760 RepID=A0A165JRZ9_XYLHT|nr:hypothetical protein L228DRAFT_257970 [Xylona heveae TC161]KZF26555.1 hypothetical protein L228DRAFT_257970 [Xylona heveae TC161]
MSTLSRRSHRKTRTGCVQCKKRRIKCDETKPRCQKCTNHSIQCTYLSSTISSSSPGGNGSPSSETPPTPFLAPERHPPITSEQPPTTPSPPLLIPSTSSSQVQDATTTTNINTNNNIEDPFLGLNMADLELLHHFSVSTCYTISRKPELVTLWRVTIPQLAFSQPFLMRGLLAISALHLARLRPSRSETYLSQAALHQDSALRAARRAMSRVTQDNCNALLAFSILVVMFAFARPREPDSLILIGSMEHGTAEWLLLLRGVHSILLSAWEHLENGVLSALFRVTAYFPNRHDEHGNGGLPSTSASASVSAPAPGLAQAAHWTPELDPLAELLDLVKAEQEGEEEEEEGPEEKEEKERQFQVYAHTIEELGKVFSLMHDSHTSMSDIMRTFIWPNRIPQGYISLLSARKQQALAIFAYYCVPLKNLELYWWMEGWSTHLLSTIYRLLDERHRLWIRWPMEQVGWEPERQI